MDIMLYYITCPDSENASELLNKLIMNKLVACGNIFPIKSMYIWENKSCYDQEYVLLGKSLSSLKSKIEMFVSLNHPYEIPCVISWPANVNTEYGEWVKNCLKG